MPLFHEDSHLCHTLAFTELTPQLSCRHATHKTAGFNRALLIQPWLKWIPGFYGSPRGRRNMKKIPVASVQQKLGYGKDGSPHGKEALHFV